MVSFTFPWFFLFLQNLFPPLSNVPAAGSAVVEKRAHLDPKDPPHTGLHIPAQGAGAVQVISGAVGSAAQQFQIVDIAHADGPLHRPNVNRNAAPLPGRGY